MRNPETLTEAVRFSPIQIPVLNTLQRSYGTRPHELDRILEGNKRKEAEYQEVGASMVDATQPIDKVVDEIIQLSSQ